MPATNMSAFQIPLRVQRMSKEYTWQDFLDRVDTDATGLYQK